MPASAGIVAERLTASFRGGTTLNPGATAATLQMRPETRNRGQESCVLEASDGDLSSDVGSR